MLITSASECFGLDFDRSYLFRCAVPCVVLTYAADGDLHVGCIDGTGLADIAGPLDLQNILFNALFVSKEGCGAWVCVESMCMWAHEMGLGGIVG